MSFLEAPYTLIDYMYYTWRSPFVSLWLKYNGPDFPKYYYQLITNNVLELASEHPMMDDSPMDTAGFYLSPTAFEGLSTNLAYSRAVQTRQRYLPVKYVNLFMGEKWDLSAKLGLSTTNPFRR